jgi:ubiquitin C-terminal hydrolase
MNAALQCLFCTTELSHLFLRGFYKPDLNMDNPLSLGWRGRVAEAFKLLVDDVHSHTETWAPQRDQWGYVTNSFDPTDFKGAIASLNGGMFAGNQQQDSQELLGAVLDGIHEDCNRIKIKPLVENLVGDGTNNTDVAREAWDRYKLRDDSFVIDTFQGQLRSQITCTECHNMSVSFDPSMYLGLSFKRVVQPPTSLENLLQEYVEEEQLTGANQWRCVHVAVLLPCCAAF